MATVDMEMILKTASAADPKELGPRNLAVGTWKNKSGEMHISLSRVSGKYHKNIAIPLELVPAVIAGLAELAAEAVSD